MLAHSIVAQRRVYDYINGSGSIPHVLDLRISCINTHSKYKEYKKEEAADKSKEDEKKKKKKKRKENVKLFYYYVSSFHIFLMYKRSVCCFYHTF